MLYTINNLWTPAGPRKTEESDTHHYIRPHDQKQQRHQHSRKKNTKDPIDVGITLSVDALIKFLNTITQQPEPGLFSKSPDENEEQPAPITKADKQLSALKTKAAKATAQYQSIKFINQPKQKDILLETTDLDAPNVPLDINTDDLRSIFGIIEDLKLLKENNIDEIHLMQANSFLEAIKRSIAMRKFQLQASNTP